MSRKIVACPSCGARFDVSAFQPGSKIRCGSCYSILRIPDTDSGVVAPEAPKSTRPRSGRRTTRGRGRAKAGIAPRKAPIAPPPAAPQAAQPVAPPPPAEPARPVPPPAAPPPPAPKAAAPATVAPDSTPPKPPSRRVDSLVGRTINKEFELKRKIGEGGYGTVYEGEDLTLKRRVAVKLMLREKTTNKEFVEKFLREARTAAQLSHPNIVKIHTVDFDRDLEQHFLAMEYVEGKTLSEFMRDEGVFEIERALDVVVQAAHGLGEAHKKNIIHRDIKPGNIMITPKGVVKVADFGLAKIYDAGDAASTIIGTPYFMPPEQFEGKVRDGRTDIYALGVTLYNLLTLKRPFDGKTPAEVLLNIIKKDPAHPKEYNPKVTDALWKIVQKMICRNVDERYATCEELLRDIHVYLEGESTEEKVFCPKCGIGNPFSAELCMECNTSLLEPCPVCGTPDFVDAKFCGSCGANLGKEREVATLLGEAESHVAAGRIESAIETYESAKEISAQNSKVIEGLDVAQQILSERDEAVGEVQRLLDDGDPVAAYEAAEKAMERFPGHAPLGELLAKARDSARGERIAGALEQARNHLQAGEFAEACAAARGALEIDPESEDAQSVLAKAEHAEAEFSRARESAATFEEGGLLTEAVAAWSEVLAIVPGDATAAEAVERLGVTVDQVESLRATGEEALAAHELAKARVALEEAAAILPGDAGVLASLDALRQAEGACRASLIGGIESLIAGQYDDCREALRELDGRFPGDDFIGVALAQANALQAASESFLEQGRALLESNRPEEASAFLRAAERISPLDGRAEVILGEVKAAKKAHMQMLATVRDLMTKGDFAGASDQLAALGGITSPLTDVAELAIAADDGLRESQRKHREDKRASSDESLDTAGETPAGTDEEGAVPLGEEGA